MAVEHKSKVAEEQERLREALANYGGKQTAEEDIIFQGTKLIIPERMDEADAMRFLGDKIEENERHMEFHRDYKFRPYDGAWATMQAMKKAFGMVQQKGVRGMFGVTPPSLITINVGPGETEQVPWGALEVPILPGVTFELSGFRDPELGTLFRLQAAGPRKRRFEIEGVFRMVEDYLETSSMYRGKAFDGQEMPEFMDTAAFDASKVVYAKDVLEQLEANVWSLMRHSATMRNNGISLKRATLFEGRSAPARHWEHPSRHKSPFRTAGRSSTVGPSGTTWRKSWPPPACTSQAACSSRMWTPSPQGEVPSKDAVTGLLDLFDGINAKGTEIMVVLTTNHAEKIHKGMVRPGRLDAVIHIGAPDGDGVERFVRLNVKAPLLSKDLDFEAIGKSMDGYLPAFITEAIDRAKRYNIARHHGVPGVMETEDFTQAADAGCVANSNSWRMRRRIRRSRLSVPCSTPRWSMPWPR